MQKVFLKGFVEVAIDLDEWRFQKDTVDGMVRELAAVYDLREQVVQFHAPIDRMEFPLHSSWVDEHRVPDSTPRLIGVD